MRLGFSAVIFLILASFTTGFSQKRNSEKVFYPDSSYAYAEIFGMATSIDRTPFWMHANQYGIVPVTGSTGSVRGGGEMMWDISRSKGGNFRAGGGVEFVGNLGKTQQFLLPQAYGSVRYKNWELFVGRKKQFVGLADTTLSSGSYSWSGNAMPLPKIQIGTRGFVPIPFTNGWVSFNAFYSDGVFESGRPYTSELKLHQKALYIKIGNSNSRLKFLGGFNHQAQWGGKSPFNTIDGQMPKGFKNYIDVVTGKAYPNNPNQFEYESRIGNHLGSIDLGLIYQGYEYSWFFYRQSLYEDGGLIRGENIVDGLNGVSIKKQNSYGADFEINHLVFELLYTKNQSGGIWDRQSIIGRDNYFNHQQVMDGWSYYNRTIGTPFIPPTSDTQWKWPVYQYTSDNRVMALHLALEGTLFQRVNWMTKMSYSSNIGTYDVPFPKPATQFSGILTLQTNLNILGGGTSVAASFAADQGTLYQNTLGFSLALRKTFGIY